MLIANITHMGDGAGMLPRVPPGVDWRKPSPARVYDVHLGGAHNFAVDREVAAEIARIMPELPELFRANRSFLRRAVRYVAEAGITQFLDLGSGIPTVGNVHEIAQRVHPESRVVYVDIDPVAVAHGKYILEGHPTAVAVHGDLRAPADILACPEVQRLLDFSRPIAVLLLASLNFVSDSDDPQRIIDGYMSAVVPGSYLLISHPAPCELSWRHDQAEAQRVYSSAVNDIYFREKSVVDAYFDGLELIDPGVVYINAWHPDSAEDAITAARLPQLGGVGRKR